VNPKKKGDPEVFTIKAENLGVGNVINIRADEAEKVQRALDNGTGVKITFDGDIQTKPILEWIHSTLHSKKGTVSPSKKKKGTLSPSKSLAKQAKELVEKVLDEEEATQTGSGGDLPFHSRGRGLMNPILGRRPRVAPSLSQYRSRQAGRAQRAVIAAQSGAGKGKLDKIVEKKVRNLLAPMRKKK
jgi:hypothetical protein